MLSLHCLKNTFELQKPKCNFKSVSLESLHVMIKKKFFCWSLEIAKDRKAGRIPNSCCLLLQDAPFQLAGLV